MSRHPTWPKSHPRLLPPPPQCAYGLVLPPPPPRVLMVGSWVACCLSYKHLSRIPLPSPGKKGGNPKLSQTLIFCASSVHYLSKCQHWYLNTFLKLILNHASHSQNLKSHQCFRTSLSLTNICSRSLSLSDMIKFLPLEISYSWQIPIPLRLTLHLLIYKSISLG